MLLLKKFVTCNLATFWATFKIEEAIFCCICYFFHLKIYQNNFVSIQFIPISMKSSSIIITNDKSVKSGDGSRRDENAEICYGSDEKRQD